jgi:Tfp pilus assembly protein FimV
MSVAVEYAPCPYPSGWVAPPPQRGASSGARETKRTTGASSLATVRVLHAPPPSAAVGLRLTCRGVWVLVALAGVLAGVLVCLGAASAPSGGSAPAVPAAVTVRAGDTLWSIAQRVAPDTDPRAEVAALRRRNHLVGTELVPGQVIATP